MMGANNAAVKFYGLGCVQIREGKVRQQKEPS
jgi:hypothetical protein